MLVYGLALLSGCMFVGMFIGNALGMILGIGKDVGGVGFAMVILMLATEYMDKKGLMSKAASKGIEFWSAMYIPIVVAMASTQNVYSALAQGWVAIVTGIAGCLVMFPLIKPMTKLTKVNENWEQELNQNK